MTQNILTIESEALAHARTAEVSSASMIFFDFAAAFPSIAHQWIFYVLRRMGLPDSYVDLIYRLYLGCDSQVTIGKQRLDYVYINSGIKQGCPLSGTIFAIVMDPLLRMLIAGPYIGRVRFGAYADDIATVLQRTDVDLPSLLGGFGVIRRASALHLKIRKCCIVPLINVQGTKVVVNWDEATVRTLFYLSLDDASAPRIAVNEDTMRLTAVTQAQFEEWQQIFQK